MFDYQAGEKYKLTLIMVGLAGLLAGMFFTVLLMPSPDASMSKRKGAQNITRAMSDPDITGRRGGGAAAPAGDGSQAAAGSAQASMSGQPLSIVDRGQAQMLVQNWLPRVWDLSAQTAAASQEEAIKWMTPECAQAYRQNIWSAETAKQISESSLVSEFHVKNMDISDNLADGSLIVKVAGRQTLKAPAGEKSKDVNLEYMLKQTPDGIRIAGMSTGSTQ